MCVGLTMNTTQAPLSPQQRSRDQAAEPSRSRRLTGFLVFAVLLRVIFVRPLISLATYAIGTDLHSRDWAQCIVDTRNAVAAVPVTPGKIWKA